MDFNNKQEVEKTIALINKKLDQGENVLDVKKQFISAGNNEQDWDFLINKYGKKSTKSLLKKIFLGILTLISLSTIFISAYYIMSEVFYITPERHILLLIYFFIALLITEGIVWLFVEKNSHSVSLVKILLFITIDAILMPINPIARGINSFIFIFFMFRISFSAYVILVMLTYFMYYVVLSLGMSLGKFIYT